MNNLPDIAGFGLLGHLLEVLKASRVSARLDLSALPVLSGAHEMIKAGIFSSLHEENIHLKRAIANLETISDHPNYPLLFDPQTAGGLLAGIAADKAEECLLKLHAAGYPQADITGGIINSDSADHFVKLSG